MPLNNTLTRRLAAAVGRRMSRLMESRAPDFVIGGSDDPYLERWWVIPRNPVFNIYLHAFHRSDEDRACHDHPWPSLSLVLTGGGMRETYLVRERTFDGTIAYERERDVTDGDLIYRGARFAHRMIVPPGGHGLTLFITGPRLRSWGFWCEGRRFVPWREFVDDKDRGLVGRGCD